MLYKNGNNWEIIYESISGSWGLPWGDLHLALENVSAFIHWARTLSLNNRASGYSSTLPDAHYFLPSQWSWTNQPVTFWICDSGHFWLEKTTSGPCRRDTEREDGRGMISFKPRLSWKLTRLWHSAALFLAFPFHHARLCVCMREREQDRWIERTLVQVCLRNVNERCLYDRDHHLRLGSLPASQNK